MTLLTPDPSPAEVTIPLFLHRASCGFPSPASDYLEGKLDLNTHCVAHPAATFYLRAEGESMTGVGIFPGDLLVVDKSLTPRHGDVVIALLDGGFTVKTLQLKPRLRLLPAKLRIPVKLNSDSGICEHHFRKVCGQGFFEQKLSFEGRHLFDSPNKPAAKRSAAIVDPRRWNRTVHLASEYVH
ncbi:translesion error-prone DNA polymerase V autoproteolytic subunit [Aeromonas veronii]|uniref:translesion error-prone DNA polymerase V autoproteolytic subunit n=5 Tax=Aeromonas veronii TaxID=654 RepID=UPI003BA32258